MRRRYSSVLLVTALAALTAHAQQMAGMSMVATPPVANTSSSSSCIHNPTTRNCTDYEYPDSSIRADMSELCEMMPYMVGCSIQRQCEVRHVAQRSCTKLTSSLGALWYRKSDGTAHPSFHAASLHCGAGSEASVHMSWQL